MIYHLPTGTAIYRYRSIEPGTLGECLETTKPVTNTDNDLMVTEPRQFKYNMKEYYWFRLPATAAPWKMIAVHMTRVQPK